MRPVVRAIAHRRDHRGGHGQGFVSATDPVTPRISGVETRDAKEGEEKSSSRGVVLAPCQTQSFQVSPKLNLVFAVFKTMGCLCPYLQVDLREFENSATKVVRGRAAARNPFLVVGIERDEESETPRSDVPVVGWPYSTTARGRQQNILGALSVRRGGDGRILVFASLNCFHLPGSSSLWSPK